jgi:OOP family OmpA-OmpF porin
MCVAAVLALAGCERAKAPPPPAPAKATPSPAPSQSDKVSIIRSDIAIDREPAPMAPLAVRIGFPENGHALDPTAEGALAGALASPQMKAGGAITLRGHSDSTGSDAANLRASQRRAEAVRDWLVDHGVDKARIAVIALGEQNPAAPNALPDGSPNEEGRALNRRVELTIAVPAGTPPAASPSESGTLVEAVTGD